MAKGKDQRRLKNLLINPEAQIRFGAIFLAMTIVSNVIVTAFGLNLYYYWANDPERSGTGGLLMMVVGGCVLVTILTYCFAFILGLIITHKIFGPLVPIQRTLDQLKAGDYSARAVLREKDEQQMKRLAESVNELAAVLARKG